MLKPTNTAELKTALLSIWNDLPQQFTDISKTVADTAKVTINY